MACHSKLVSYLTSARRNKKYFFFPLTVRVKRGEDIPVGLQHHSQYLTAYWLVSVVCMYVCVRGGPNQPLHRDPQWSIVLCFGSKYSILSSKTSLGVLLPSCGYKNTLCGSTSRLPFRCYITTDPQRMTPSIPIAAPLPVNH
jgi:hypothetical protein